MCVLLLTRLFLTNGWLETEASQPQPTPPKEFKKLPPDLVVKNIKLVQGCKIKVTIKNIGKVGVPISYYTNPDAVSIQMYNGSKPWGGIILNGFDKDKKLTSPGGKASWIWFPNAANLNLKAGYSTITVKVDNLDVLKEADETNNSMTKRLYCGIRKQQPKGIQAPTGLTITTRKPEKIKLVFSKSQLTYNKTSKKVKWVADGFHISPGDRIEVCNLTPSIYHLRHAHWPTIFWEIDFVKSKLYYIKGATCCQPVTNHGGLTRTELPTIVEGSSSSSTMNLKFKEAHMLFYIKQTVIRLFGEGYVLGFEYEWEKRNLANDEVYHLRLRSWTGNYFWEVNFPQRKVWRIDGGTFGVESTSSTKKKELPFQVIPMY
jgi:hypothetical protein